MLCITQHADVAAEALQRQLYAREETAAIDGQAQKVVLKLS